MSNRNGITIAKYANFFVEGARRLREIYPLADAERPARFRFHAETQRRSWGAEMYRVPQGLPEIQPCSNGHGPSPKMASLPDTTRSASLREPGKSRPPERPGVDVRRILQ